MYHTPTPTLAHTHVDTDTNTHAHTHIRTAAHASAKCYQICVCNTTICVYDMAHSYSVTGHIYTMWQKTFICVLQKQPKTRMSQFSHLNVHMTWNIHLCRATWLIHTVWQNTFTWSQRHACRNIHIWMHIWHDTFTCVVRHDFFIQYDRTHSYEAKDTHVATFTFECTYDMTHSSVSNDMTHSYSMTGHIYTMWQETFICVLQKQPKTRMSQYSHMNVHMTRHIHAVWHDSFIQCDMTHSYSATEHIHMCRTEAAKDTNVTTFTY